MMTPRSATVGQRRCIYDPKGALPTFIWFQYSPINLKCQDGSAYHRTVIQFKIPLSKLFRKFDS